MAYFNGQATEVSLKNRLFMAGQVFAKNRLVKSVLRWTVLLGIFTYLLFRLSTIGWTDILQSLPSSPLFYLLSITFVFLPIIAERIAFPMVAKTQSTPPFRVFIRKHVINKAVMNYAGEGYFIQQVTKLEGLNLKSAAIVVKNLTLVRTFVANFWVVFLVACGLILGNAAGLQKIALVSPMLVVTVSIVSLGFCIGSVIFFRKLTRLEFGLAGKVASIYLIRSSLAACVLIAQWNLALPGTSLAVWGLFLIVFFIAKKSPVGGELVFVSVALTLPGLGGDSAAVAAMLLAMAAVVQIIYTAGFVMTSEFIAPKHRPELYQCG